MNNQFNFDETFHSIWCSDDYLNLKKDGWGFLYVMEGLNPDNFEPMGVYKIGIATDISKRLRWLEKENLTYPKMELHPKLIKALFTYNPEEKEWILHSFFDDFRIGGEWFKLNANDLFFLMLMNSGTIDNIKNSKYPHEHEL